MQSHGSRVQVFLHWPKNLLPAVMVFTHGVNSTPSIIPTVPAVAAIRDLLLRVPPFFLRPGLLGFFQRKCQELTFSYVQTPKTIPDTFTVVWIHRKIRYTIIRISNSISTFKW